MAGSNDTIDTGMRVRFVDLAEVSDLDAIMVDLDREKSKILRSRASTPKEKWLYVFWSEGRRYGFDLDARWGGPFYQHGAKRKGRRPVNPERSQDHAEHPWRELYFDEDGRFSWVDIGPSPASPGEESPLWEEPRHERPKPSGPPADTMPLPLGDSLRYYFLLSPVRLGPAALNEATKPGDEATKSGDDATKPGGADALSVYPYAFAVGPVDEDGEPRTKQLEPSDWITAPSPERITASRSVFFNVGVVDPYSVAERLHEDLRSALEAAAEVDDAMLRGGSGPMPTECVKGIVEENLPWVDDVARATDASRYYDAYFIARTIEGLRRSEPGAPAWEEWDDALAGRFLEEMERFRREEKNAPEVQARFLANWLSSPAHRLVDLAISEDAADELDGGGSVEEQLETEAAADRAFGLVHWERVTSLLPTTRVGSLFLGQKARGLGESDADRAGNPVTEVLLPYVDRPLESTNALDEAAFRLAAAALPDLVARFVVLDVEVIQLRGSLTATPTVLGSTRAAAERAKALLNNLRLLPYAVELDRGAGAGGSGDASEDPVSGSAKAKTFGDAGQLAVQLAIDAGEPVESLLEGQQPATKRTPGALGRSARIGGAVDDTIGAQLAAILKAKDALAAAQGCIGVFNLMLMSADRASRVPGEASVRQQISTILESVEAIQSASAAFGISDWLAERLKASARPSLRAFVARQLPSRILGGISGVWAVCTATGDLRSAKEIDDQSVAAGSAITILGGMTAVAAAVAWVPVVGFFASALVLAGALFAAFTADSPLRTFVKHCVFSKWEDKYRNVRAFGDDEHWAGPLGQGRVLFTEAGLFGGFRTYKGWPVDYQAWALENLLSTFSMRSGAATDTLELYVRHAFVSISPNYIPPDAVLRVSAQIGDVESLSTLVTRQAVLEYDPLERRVSELSVDPPHDLDVDGYVIVDPPAGSSENREITIYLSLGEELRESSYVAIRVALVRSEGCRIHAYHFTRYAHHGHDALHGDDGCRSLPGRHFHPNGVERRVDQYDIPKLPLFPRGFLAL